LTSATLRRLERVLVMVPWLLEHGPATVDDLVARFGGTRDDILADLDTLGYCGLPGYGGGDLVEVTVFGDEVSVRMADFFARPLSLSLKEGVTLLLAARALADLEFLPESGALQRAAGKLERLLGADTAALALDLEATGAEHVPEVREALVQRRVVRLEYRSDSKGELTHRLVEPWALTARGGAWYLQGWCRLADGPRDFRLDRVRVLEVTGERAPDPAGAPAEPVYVPGSGDPTVVLELVPEAAWLADWLVTDAVEDRGGRTRVTFRTRTLEWAARLVLGAGGAARVVAPPALAEQVAALAAAVRARHEP
jgi:predicted DNA-binding transcriptional regulator YafY